MVGEVLCSEVFGHHTTVSLLYPMIQTYQKIMITTAKPGGGCCIMMGVRSSEAGTRRLVRVEVTTNAEKYK